MAKRFKSIDLIALGVYLLFTINCFAQEDFLGALIKEALKSSPYIKNLEKEWQAREEKILSEKTLPQPQLRFTYPGESIQTKLGPQDKKYGVTQKIPFPTKLSLKGRIATKDAEIAYIKYLLGVREIIQKLKVSFYDYYFLTQALKILEEEKSILENMFKTVQRKYETKLRPQQDLIKASLAISKIEEKILTLKKQKNFLRSRINKILNRPQDKEFRIPPDFTLSALFLNKNKENLLKEALERSPLVLLAKLGVDRQRLKLSLSKQGYLPDFMVMADYIEIGEGTTKLADDGKDAWMVGIGITFPLWFWKINSQIDSDKLKLEAQQEKYEDREDLISFKIEDLYFKLITNYKLIDLYKNVIIPQAEQNFSTSGTSYEEGLIDFLSWLDAERNLINLRLAKIRQITEYNKTLAELEYIVGEDLQ